MKLKQVLEIQKVLGNKIPIDMNEKWVYHSESRGEWVDLMQLDVIHAIRILRKHIVDIEQAEYTEEDSYEQPTQ
jgi:hypothetical protein|tara:strand:+ start:1214 stop:1435 length:222 start_codon:yes stop_codon:yes gene_type:complete